ncbi:MAG: autotransporter domain-containing protein [Pseudomonadota bacterium]|nr:autotransporter domain-containing protein [Pseudomonadota bacterium]
MKKNLLFTTALVAATFAASGVLAADPTTITSQDELNTYLNSGKGDSWTDIVTIQGTEDLTVNNDGDKNRFIEADNLQIENGSNVTVDGQGNFIGGDTVGIQQGATVNLKNQGHLLVTREEDGSVNTLTIDGTVNMDNGIIRAAASEADPKSSHGKVVLGETGVIDVAGNNNIIASYDTEINGKLNVNSGTLDLVGGLSRGEDGLLSMEAKDKEKPASFTIEKTGVLTIASGATANTNASDIFNNGTITNEGTFNITSDYNSDGGKYNGGYTQTGGSINLTNGAELISSLENEDSKETANTVALNNVDEVNISNGSAIHAVYLEVDNDEGKTTKINIAGNNPDAGRPQKPDQSDTWRNNAQLLSYGNATLNNTEINIGEGGMLLQGALGTNEDPTPATMTLKNSKVEVAEGGLIKATNDSNYGLDTTEIDLAGSIEANIASGTNSTINVTGSKAYIEKITALDNLNIAADVASSSLFGKGAAVTNTTVADGKSFVLDSAAAENKFTTSTLDVNGTLRISDKANTAGYDIAQTKVASQGVLDLGKNTYKSDVTLDNGATLNVGIGEEGDKIVNGKIDGKLSAASGEGEQSNLNLIFDEGLSNEDLKEGIEFASSAEGNLALKDNLLYNYDKSELKDGKLGISKKDASAVSADLIKSGVGVNQAGVLAAFTAGQSGLIASDAITHEFSNSLQRGQTLSAADMAEVLAPMAAPMVRTVETSTMAHAYDAVSSQLSGGTISSAANGKSSGDSAMTGVTTWVQGLYNNSKLDGTSKAKGFDSDSAGVAMGIHKAINKDVKAGIAYSYADTDVDAYRRNIDVKSHTFMAYGEYKPSNWFVNGIASYGMSDYDEHKKVFGGVKADYDVKSYGLQAMTGYDTCFRGLNVTPQAGLRYAHIKQKSYTDTAGQHVSGDDMDILTGIVGVKASRDFALDNGMFIRPEARVAMTYDLMDPDNNSNVALANGATYRINGEKLDRFSVEAGAGVTAELNDAWEVSAGYEGKFRDDYKDHSGILSAKYKF